MGPSRQHRPSGAPVQDAPTRAPAPVRTVADRLAETYPDARTALVHHDAFELLVATVLSAQTTDVRVNQVTPELFDRWPDAPALAAADPGAVEAVLRPVGMAPTKSRRIVALALALVDDHHGEVPEQQDALEALPGVGRKTALVVRGVWYGADALAVDTHVGRLARRLGWASSTDPARVERDVVVRVQHAGAPAIALTSLSLRLIEHGRAICHAHRPACGQCVLADLCPSAGAAA